MDVLDIRDYDGQRNHQERQHYGDCDKAEQQEDGDEEEEEEKESDEIDVENKGVLDVGIDDHVNNNMELRSFEIAHKRR